MGFVAVKCPQCGADIQLDDSREFGFCNYCGTKVMQDKVVIEHKGNVSIDNSKKLDNLYQIARRAKNDNNSEKAAQYYDMVLQEDPNSWEANFYTVYYQSMNCKIAGIQSAAIRITNCEDTVMKLIKENVPDEAEQGKALDEMAADCISISRMLYNAAKNHYDGIGDSIKDNYTQEMINNCCAARDICYYFGDYVIKLFGDKYGNNIAVPCWKTGITQHNGLMKYFEKKDANKDIIMSYVSNIQKFDASYKAPYIDTTKSSGCYVATAVYGSYDCPEVWTLRRFRDYSLALTWYGRLFITLYYAISPTIVKWFGHTQWFNKMWRGKLDRMVERLQSEGFENTPYQDKDWK